MMLNCFDIDKLHGFMMHRVMWAVGRISQENDYSFLFLNVVSYAIVICNILIAYNTHMWLSKCQYWILIVWMMWLIQMGV